MRRKAGVGAIQKQKLQQEKYQAKTSTLQENQIEQLSKQLEVFRTNLEEFASKHKAEIKKNSEFRKQFQAMCASIGVDPLASKKGFWSVLGIGDFYYELSVQIIEVCLATNHKNGGLISLDELRNRLIKARGQSKHHQEISKDDLICAAQKLKVLGNGFTVIPIGRGDYMVQSVPGELSMEQTAVLTLLSKLGGASISESQVVDNLKWEKARATKALKNMVQDGLAWVDTQSDEPTYWLPSLFFECVSDGVSSAGS
ncbi:vacuolar-sorting protein SNF8 [Bemisia tabaci]